MLIVQGQRKIFGKYLQLPNGQMVRAYFLVTEQNGVYYSKLLKVEFLTDNDNGIAKAEIVALPLELKKRVFGTRKVNSTVVVSPYLNNQFFTSQMTRAPSRGV